MISISISFGRDFTDSDRFQKGKSLLLATGDYTVIDIETTGLDPHFCEIIEISAIKYRNDEETSAFHTLVKPQEEIDDFITKLTGITSEMVATAPNIAEVLPQFLQFLGNDILVAHNANFDVNFIYDTCCALNLPPLTNDFIDTLRLSRRLYPDLEDHKLRTVCKKCGVVQTSAHRAKVDCDNTHMCYVQMKRFAEENGITIADFAKRKRDYSYKKLSEDVKAEKDQFNMDGPVYGKTFVFTGKLEIGTRKDAMQAVVNCGGLCEDSVTAKTNFLVLGNNDYCKAIKEGKSNKQKKAEKLQLEGKDIQVISEYVFCDMLKESQLNNEEMALI